jgi:hypothetical protein
VFLQGPEIENQNATQRPKPGAKTEFFCGNGNSSNHKKTNISMGKIKAGLQSQRRQLENGFDCRVAPETGLISGAG